MKNLDKFINFFARTVPSWFKIRHTNLVQTEYFRERYGYWQRNSIYLDNIFNKISVDVAMVKFRHVKITRNRESPDEIENLEKSDLTHCLTVSPNDYETPIVFWSNVVRKMLKEQIAVVIPTYRNNILQSLQLAQSVESFENHNLILQVENQTFSVDINSVWVFENPKQNISAQLGQVTKLIDDNLRALSIKLSDGNSKLHGFLKLPTSAQDSELKKRAQMRVENIMESARNGGIGFLQNGEEFQELSNTYNSASESELEFLKMQLYQAFGINEKLFTCDYTEEQYRAYFSSVLKVYQRVLAEEINRKFFSKTARTQGQKLLVYFDMYDISSLKDLNEFAFKTKYAGILNANEIREIFGYGAYSGGNVFETNKNAVQISGQNSESEVI